MSKKYELLLVLPGTLDENAAAVRCEEIVSLVKESASDVEMNVLGKSRLAYPVKQIRYGYFYTIVFSAETDGLKVIKTKLELMRDLLRAMLSVFKTNLTATQRIAYATNELGITTMAPQAEESVVEKKVVMDKQVDLAEIDKKLDEILDGNVIPGV
ncbi:MAG: 30S ribosomal protein S6 [Candidatus Magasanikbacteria bacterium RIFOXYA2_FULL_44_8]|uniref:Small ribosomal subunit protein bS6 n=1 Tax=Candidatus Magasanikbacteria bacterium RIFOXYA2_FULL_44_8 TaxID=1798696 RepID=A0A1F6NKY3_9BACT|nr:MAG: 30S ribosomal protein S6 [Candidatus Magasanikbacteria bacterium RIFOXYA2_FULL_44_8]